MAFAILWFCVLLFVRIIQVRRVPTADNIADDPSREDYELLRRLGADSVVPVTPAYLWDTKLWEQLVLTDQCQ